MKSGNVWTRRGVVLAGAAASLMPGCGSTGSAARPAPAAEYFATTEFEAQEYIWVTWGEDGFLGGPPMIETTIALIKAITPQVRVRILYNQWLSWVDQLANPAPSRTLEAARHRITSRLAAEGVDTGRVELIVASWLFGAIQDPGPVFLRQGSGGLAIADFASSLPMPLADRFDRDLVAPLGISAVRSPVVCDGGNRQCNGRGVVMLGGTFAQSVNPARGRDEMEAEYRRVCGAEKVIWLAGGPREEDWGLLDDGRWGIGTAGHVDEFCRFVDETTILLAEVPEADRDRDSIHAETHRRMEENFAIVSAARDINGQPFRILRAPTALPMTHVMNHEAMSDLEQTWFEGAAKGQDITFYLPGSYINFVIANGVVVTSRYWREGLDPAIRIRDAEGLAAVQAAFPARRVVQIDATPMLHDGGGLHCYTRNQPFAVGRSGG